MRRTLILSALGSTTLLIGLGVGATLATADPVQPSPTAISTMMDHSATGCPMTGMTGMTGMTDMTGMEMTQMMQMMGSMMMGSSPMGTEMPASDTAHGAHHQEIRP